MHRHRAGGHVHRDMTSIIRCIRAVVSTKTLLSHLDTSPHFTLCRRWRISCRTLSISFVRSHLILSRLSKCPRSCLFDVPMRAVLRDTQLVDQLVEVPTIISYSSLQRTVEQHVDIPLPGRGGRNAGLQCISFGQSSTASQLSLERVSERIAEQSSIFLFLVEAFKIFALDRVHSLLCTFQLLFMKSWMSLVQGVFALFPGTNKVRRPQPPRVRACPPVSAHGLGRLMRQRMRRGVRRNARRRFA